MNAKRKIKYIFVKIVQMLLVMIILSMVVFLIVRLTPGSPLKAYYGDGVERMSTVEKEAAMDKLGLNDSLITQYVRWADNAFHGDFGISYKYKQPVTTVIEKVWKNTFLLGGLSYILIFGLSIILGLFCAFRENTLTDRIICKIGVISGNIPTFFLALVFILVFAVNLKIFPTSGVYSLGEDGNALDRIYHLILPLSVLVIEHLWYYTYMIRNKLMDETRKDYVLLCKANGLSKMQIMVKHCLRNIMPPLLVIMAISLPHILGGTYIVETVFSYPGIGSLSFESAQYKDYNMLLILCLITGFIVVVFNILAQVINEQIDTRMRYERDDLNNDVLCRKEDAS